ncbi:hypothetical protein Patl_0913 [Paraglaciecola sp. T6c]|uniref:hypothetical protein n=1 Tax=Pseudoalteromonas atlantica (strain T6c / ATCC BAA-1087) TaxID=3042615 RepID=UPI00005C644D|nr:hypothetical protein [Paraglaciecola sp. T6c]ABG39439.1 hypothetical protein Patl_0913 [Paraglaciecola sp. T6c]
MAIIVEDSIQEPKGNPLGEINAQFHRLYQVEKAKAVASINDGEVMLICRIDSRLIVKAGSKVKEYVINDERYQSLKAMSHGTLAVYYQLCHSVDEATLCQVNRWVSQIRQQAPLSLGKEVADVTMKLLERIEHSNVLPHSAMSLYQQELESIYAKLMTEAVNDEIDNLVSNLERVCSEDDYPSSNIFMIVFGGHQPRYKALALQVFKKWFAGNQRHISNCEHHVRYCEAGESLDDAVDLVATAIVDRELARSTMGYSEALNRDVLSAVAEKAIEEYWLNNSLR